LYSFVYDNMPTSVTSDVSQITRHDCHLGPGFGMFNLEIHLHRLLLNGTLTAMANNLAVVSNGDLADVFYVPVYPNLYMCAMAARHNRTFDRADYAEALDIGEERNSSCF